MPSPPAGGQAQGGAGGVECDVPATHHNEPLADVGTEALVDVEEELDRSQDAVELVAREVETPPPARADRQEQ